LAKSLVVWWHCESRFNPSPELVVSQKKMIIEIDQRNCCFIFFEISSCPKGINS